MSRRLKHVEILVLLILAFVCFAVSLSIASHKIDEIQSEYNNAQDELSLAREALNDSDIVNYELKQLNDRLLEENDDLREDILFLRVELGKVQKEYEEYIKEQESSSISRGNINRDEMSLFYKLVESEATGQSFEAKVNVANVVLNRIKSDQFPNTISSVVYQPKQFSVVSDDRINQVKIKDSTIEAVEYAMNNLDTTKGALFFMNKSASSSDNASWFESKLEYIMSDDSGHSFWK